MSEGKVLDQFYDVGDVVEYTNDAPYFVAEGFVSEVLGDDLFEVCCGVVFYKAFKDELKLVHRKGRVNAAYHELEKAKTRLLEARAVLVKLDREYRKAVEEVEQAIAAEAEPSGEGRVSDYV